MRIVAIIPARYWSTRFRGKPLALIGGKPMIQWVYEKASACRIIQRTIVATDEPDIARAVERFGGEAAITAATHQTGTDRVAEVARQLDADVIVNLQGDEPLVPPEAVEAAIGCLLQDERVGLSTLKTRLRDASEISDPNIVKVVTDQSGMALYFSRSPIPWAPAGSACGLYYRHIGLYVYRRAALLHLAGLPPSFLEQTERLEQLRVLENGYPIRVAETDYYPIGVDVPGDIDKIERFLNMPPQPLHRHDAGMGCKIVGQAP